MPPKIRQTDVNAAEALGLTFSAPPEIERTRTSKHAERWATARDLCMKYPGQTLKVLTYKQASQPYAIAKQINNGEHRSFPDNEGMALFKALGGKDVDDEDGNHQFSVWLTYIGE